MSTYNVDPDYVWALEVIACDALDGCDDPDPEYVSDAAAVLENAPLRRPMDRV